MAADNTSIPLGAFTTSSDRLSLAIPLADPASAPPGTYTLVWRVLSAADGHVTTGTVAFSVGTGVAPSAGGTAEARPPWWRVGLRWLELTGLTFITGIFVFAVLIARHSLRELDERSRLLGKIAVVATAVVLAVSGYDLGVSAVGARFFDPPGWSVYRDVLFQSTVGRSWLAILACVLVIALILFIDRLRRGGTAVGLAAGLAALLANSVAGHAAAVSPAWRAILIDWIHLGSVACWFGCLPYLWLSLRHVESYESESASTATIVARFSRFGLGLMGTIVVSGLLRASTEVSGPSALTESDYGRVLIAKHLLLAPVLIAAGVNLLLLVPRLKRAAPGNVRLALRSAKRFVGIELAVATLILLAAGGLTEMAPADAPLPVDVATRPMTIEQRAEAADLSVWLLARLTGATSDRYTITIAGSDGRPPADLQRVIVATTTQIEGATAGDRFDAEPLIGSPGTYVFPAIRLGLPGQWNIDVVVRRAGVEDVSSAFPIDTTNAGARPPRLVADRWRLPRVTLPSSLLGLLAFASLIGGIVAVRKQRDLQPFAAAIMLTMTVLIAAGFAVQGYRQTVPVSAGTELVNPVPADGASVQRGEELYRSLCLQCHGPNGAGIETDDPSHQHAGGTSLNDRRTQLQSDGDLFWEISNGIGGSDMPAFDAALTDQERWDLVNYLRNLKSRAPTSTPESGT